jgi:hypothetical protein
MTSRNLIDDLLLFLEGIFGEKWLKAEADKLRLRPRPRGKAAFAPDIRIHDAARWWLLCKKLASRNYRFDLRFSTDIEAFMDLMIFFLSSKTLLEKGVVKKENRALLGRLKDLGLFQSLFYEMLIAANYVTQDFDVAFTELEGSGRFDLRVERLGSKACIECKRLEPRNPWEPIASILLSELERERINVAVEVTVKRKPQSNNEVRHLVEVVIQSARKGPGHHQSDGIEARVAFLPEESEGDIFVPVNIERPDYVAWSMQAGVINGRPRIRDAKLVVFRDLGKTRRVVNMLKKRLEDAKRQLSSTSVECLRIVLLDVSSAVGRRIHTIGSTSEEPFLTNDIVTIIQQWMENNPDISRVIVTRNKLHLDPFNIPFALVIEPKVFTPQAGSSPFDFQGWSTVIGLQLLPDPPDARILTNMGAYLAERGLFRRALGYYDLAIGLDSSLKEAWNNKGRALNELGEFTSALANLDKALSIDPNYSSAWSNRGISLFSLGHIREAEECFKKATNIDPRNAKAWYNMGLLKLHAGLIEGATTCARKSLAIDPNYDAARELIAECERRLQS